MSDARRQISEWLADTLDQAILSVDFSVFVPAQRESQASLIEIGLTVDGAGFAKFKTSPDGEGISLSLDALREADLGELGAVRLKTEFGAVNGADLVGQSIQRASMFVFELTVVGLELVLSNAQTVILLNIGDDLTLIVGSGHPMLHEIGMARVEVRQ